MNSEFLPRESDPSVSIAGPVYIEPAAPLRCTASNARLQSALKTAISVLSGATRPTTKSLEAVTKETDDSDFLNDESSRLEQNVQQVIKRLRNIWTEMVSSDASQQNLLTQEDLIIPELQSNGRSQEKSDHDNPPVKSESMISLELSSNSFLGQNAKNWFADNHSDEVTAAVEAAITNRDQYWRQRIKDAANLQSTQLNIQGRQSLNRRFTDILERLKTERLEVEFERDKLKQELHGKIEEQSTLRKRIELLETEVNAAMKIIHQFSELLHDKASSVCQYCRRSGTLPPLK